MTKTLYITGDRAINPLAAVNLVAGALSILTLENKAEPFAIVTGNAPTGVERAVRYLIPAQAVKVFEREKTAEGKVDFDTQHTLIKDDVDEVIFLHTEPLGSTIGKSVAKIFPPEKVRYLMQEMQTKSDNFQPDISTLVDAEAKPEASTEEPEAKPEA
jgi:hypothetical protein